MEQLQQEQFIPISRTEAWKFFASPHNLAKITPPSLDFQIASEVPAEMFEGLEIFYRVRPLLGIPLTWQSRITKYEPPVLFVDEQLKGPYKTWIHQHSFREVEGGTLLKDFVQYEVGWGMMGRLANRLVVRRRLAQIFAYRRRVIEQVFNKKLQ